MRNAYIYKADMYCEECGCDIRLQIRKEARTAGLSLDKYLDGNRDDSDSWPQGPFTDGGGEADCPQHCGSGESCLDAIVLKDGSKVGCFLENPLTAQGLDFLLRCEPSEVVDIWTEFYGVSFTTEDAI